MPILKADGVISSPDLSLPLPQRSNTLVNQVESMGTVEGNAGS
jgi:hypothetical protein